MRACKIFSQVTEAEINQWFTENPSIEIEDLRIPSRTAGYTQPVSRRATDPSKPAGDYDLIIHWMIIFYKSTGDEDGSGPEQATV